MMSDGMDSAVSPSRLRWKAAWGRLVLPGWLFTFLVTLLFASLILLGLLAVVALTYAETVTSWRDRILDCGWALLSLSALIWALANIVWLAKAAGLNRAWAAYSHLAIALGCGLIALGIHCVLFARSIGSQPIIMDYSDRVARVSSSAGPSAAAIEGDSEEGRKIFSTTCITCHGPTGDGMPNLAPSLRKSSFLASADAVAIANVIRLGRAVADPDNKTKKMMPARGGNPFLGDDKIAHLVAFIQALQTEGPSTTGTEPDPDAPPPVQLAKWVVPEAPPPPAGMESLELQDTGDLESLAQRGHRRRLLLVRSASLGLTGVHFLLLIGVIIASGNVLVRDLLSDSPGLVRDPFGRQDSWWSWSTLGWFFATLFWLFVFLVGFVVT